MSLFSRLVETLKEDTSDGMVGAAVSPGNPSVAYLPGGFTSMRNMLRSLNPVKKKWNLKVEEDKENYNIKVEDAMHIVCPKQFYEHFNSNVYDVVNNSTLDLTQIINEGTEELVELAYEKITNLLVNLENNPRVKQTVILMNQWIQTFPSSQFLANRETLISLNAFDRSIDIVMSRLRNTYKDILGTLEQIITALESNEPLNAFKPFLNYENFIGVVIKSEYEGIEFEVEFDLDLGLIPEQSIWMDSKELAANLVAYKSIKIANQTAYPLNYMFSPTLFKTIKEEAAELGQK